MYSSSPGPAAERESFGELVKRILAESSDTPLGSRVARSAALMQHVIGSCPPEASSQVNVTSIVARSAASFVGATILPRMTSDKDDLRGGGTLGGREGRKFLPFPRSTSNRQVLETKRFCMHSRALRSGEADTVMIGFHQSFISILITQLLLSSYSLQLVVMASVESSTAAGGGGDRIYTLHRAHSASLQRPLLSPGAESTKLYELLRQRLGSG